jgi:putative addiction module component (TIGR02574 family)
MTRAAEQLLEKALQLAPDDRARIASQLLSSLDDVDADVRAAWADEITRRAADADSDPADEQDWRAALDEIRQDVLRR